MKQIGLGMTAIALILIFFLSIMTIEGRNAREQELSQGVETAMEQTVSYIKEAPESPYESQEAFIGTFKELLQAQLKSQWENVQVKVKEADWVKGLLSAKVEASYKNLDGSKGEVSVERTMILEQYDLTKEEKVEVSYWVDEICYKTYTYTYTKKNEGETQYPKLLFPPDPTKEGYTFLYWADEQGNRIMGEDVEILENRKIHAVFQ